MFGKKKSEVEFKGVSVSNEKRNAIVLFIVEIVAVILFIGGVLAVLNYVGIISLSSINSAIFSNLPVKEQESEQIEVVSDIPGYSLKLENEEELLKILESWGVYGKDYGITYGAMGNTEGKPLETIVIHLVDQPQGTNAFGRDKTKEGIYSSSLTTISPGRFDINIYISKDIIDGLDENLPPNIVFRTTFFASIFRIANPTRNADETITQQQKFYSDYQYNEKMQMDFFEIAKK